MSNLRIVLYLNQFFAGLGGEDKADVAPQVLDSVPGVAAALNNELGGAAQVVATVLCGDNYMAANGEQAAREIADLVEPFEPNVVVAGPAFGAGRYGLACGQVCAAVRDSLGVPAVTGMFEENPAVELYRADAIIVPTAKTARGMREALPRMAKLALKMARGENLAFPEQDGYLAQGYRRNEFAEKRGSTRAIEMLLSKIKGDRVITEWPVPQYDPVSPLAPLDKADHIRVAMITTSGLVPMGNPDRVPSAWATEWFKYDLTGVTDLTPEAFETIHGGYDTTAANADPDRIVPIDVFRELEQEGKIELYPKLYATTGNMGSISDMKRMGRELAEELSTAGIDAVIVGAT